MTHKKMSSVVFFTSDKTSRLSNYYPCEMVMHGKKWSSSLAYFQACKFFGTPEGDAYAEIIRLADQPMKISSLGSRRMRVPANWKLNKSDSRKVADLIDFFNAQGLTVRSDWNTVKEEMMLIALRAKFSQNPELRQFLLATGDSILVENYTDSYWSSGKINKDGTFTGLNRLGQLLMQVRDELRPTFVLQPEEFPPLHEEQSSDWADSEGEPDFSRPLPDLLKH